MPISISGGNSLEYHVGLDTDDFITASNKLEAKLKETAKVAVIANEQVQKSMTESAQGLSKSVANNPFKSDFVKSAKDAGTAVEEVGSKMDFSEKKATLLSQATNALQALQLNQAGSADAATVAQESLNLAMDANPIALIILAIQAVITAYEFFANRAQEAADQQVQANEAMASAAKIMVELAEASNQVFKDRAYAAQQAVSLAQAQGKSENEILGLRQKALQAKKEENQANLLGLTMFGINVEQRRTEVETMEEQIKALKQQEQIYAQILQDSKELSDTEAAKLKDIRSQEKILENVAGPARKYLDSIRDADSEAANLRAEKVKKAHDDTLASAKAEADDRLVNAKKNSKAELDARINDIRVAARVELDNVNLTAAQRKLIRDKARNDEDDANRTFHLLQLNDQKALIETQIKGADAGCQGTTVKN